MALIKCKECKEEVSDQAKSCPNCGWPIARVKIDKTTEYNALRAEIIHSIGIRHQLVTLSVVLLAAVIAFKPISEIILLYPFFGLFIALGWKHCDNRINEIGNYIRKKIEHKDSRLNWETYLYRKRRSVVGVPWRELVISTSGIIVVAQALSVFAYLLTYDFKSNPPFILSDVIIIFITFRVLFCGKTRSKNKPFNNNFKNNYGCLRYIRSWLKEMACLNNRPNKKKPQCPPTPGNTP